MTSMSADSFSSSDIEWLPVLTIWLSPAYPVGAYSYSHGLEWAIEAREVFDRDSLQDYAATALEQGGGWTDLVLLASAWRAAAARNAPALERAAEFARALRATSEFSRESMQQGAAFVAVTRAAWPGTALDDLSTESAENLAYPIAVGAACGGRAPLGATLAAYALAFVANLISAGVRLIPLGQTDGQRALAGAAPLTLRVAARAACASLEDVGSAAPEIEIASMRHETQYTRLFRS